MGKTGDAADAEPEGLSSWNGDGRGEQELRFASDEEPEPDVRPPPVRPAGLDGVLGVLFALEPLEPTLASAPATAPLCDPTAREAGGGC